MTTWHHGLVARWWAEFNVDGPEIAYFRELVERHGEPALDVGCGTGRILIPLLRDGVDIDGVDVSGDMLVLCRARAEREGLAPGLFEQPMHELRLSRLYRTIFVCGSFGIGGVRALDRTALTRFREHLAPGGVLAIDRPGARSTEEFQAWAERAQSRSPGPWPAAGERRTAADGSTLELKTRLAGVDAVDRIVTREIWVGRELDGELVEQEQYLLEQCIYSEEQLVEELEAAGFAEVRGVDGYDSERPSEAAVRVVLATR